MRTEAPRSPSRPPENAEPLASWANRTSTSLALINRRGSSPARWIDSHRDAVSGTSTLVDGLVHLHEVTEGDRELGVVRCREGIDAEEILRAGGDMREAE